MTTVELAFPSNRYHGNAWGRHVNEGVAEWPPSPYRLLRALYDAWKRKCAHVPEEDVRDVFMALAGELPVFRLPKAVASHTRSYLSSNTENPADKSLIFDGFIALAPNTRCFIEWPVSLSAKQRAILSELLAGLNYLGRSESWIEASLHHTSSATGEFECAPASYLGRSGELVYLACPASPGEYTGKEPWLKAIAYSTGDQLRERRSSPPAMKSVPYVLQTGAITTWLSPSPMPRRVGVSAVALELHDRVLPLATETVRYAEAVRAQLMTHASKISRLVHGKDDAGEPLKDHSHLFILPTANTQGRINRILIFSRKELLGPEDLESVIRVRRIAPWEMRPVRAVVSWMGRYDDVSFRSQARRVVSTTPFVTVRHWRKGRGAPTDFLIEEVRRECRNHELPEPVHITPMAQLGSRFLPVQFRRYRKGDPPRPGHSFRIEFPKPVSAPFTLGYGCHFGLGQFDIGQA